MSTAENRPVGSRRGGRPRRDRTTAVALLVLVAAAAAVAVGARGSRPVDDPAETAATGTLVDSTSLACPDSSETDLTGGDLRTTVDAGLADVAGDLPADLPLARGGSVSAGAAGRDGSDLGLTRGDLADVSPDPAPVIRGTGSGAVGLFADRTDRTGTGTAVARCVEPGGSWWFTGAGAGLDHGSDLVLTNLDPGPAVLDVRVYGPDGPVDTLGTRGITVASGESRTLSMTDVAPQVEELVIEVTADRGRVAAAVIDRFAPRPQAGVGIEWLPATNRPSRNLRLVGLPARAVSRTLMVANPSESQALVDVRIAGRSGTFAPADLDQVSVAPGAVQSVDLGDVVPADEPVAVRIGATVPVVAAVRSVGPRDVAYAGPVAALVGPAAAPVLERAVSTVHLTAGARPATAEVVGYSRTGKVVGREEVVVDATATATSQVATRAAYVLVRPLRGTVYGAVGYVGTGVLAQTPLVPLPLSVLTPRVVPGPR